MGLTGAYSCVALGGGRFLATRDFTVNNNAVRAAYQIGIIDDQATFLGDVTKGIGFIEAGLIKL